MVFSKEENANRTVYLSGPISSDEHFVEHFGQAVSKLREMGYTKIINPAMLFLWGLEYEQYMQIDFACIDVSDDVFFMKGYENSKGSLREYSYARYQMGKNIIEEGEVDG